MGRALKGPWEEGWWKSLERDHGMRAGRKSLERDHGRRAGGKSLERDHGMRAGGKNLERRPWEEGWWEEP